MLLSYPHYYRLLASGANVLWRDNFSKFVARTIPTQEKGTFSSCLWTGAALFHYNTENLSDRVRYDRHGAVVPAMPENILVCREAVVDGLRSVVAEGHRYYDNSLVARYDVRTVPLKIDGKRFPDMNCTVNHARSKMSIVHPQELIGTNIGSNRGLLSVIRKYYDEYNMAGAQGDCVRYLSLNVDENIFWRVLKVTCPYVWLSICHRHCCFRCLIQKYLSTHFCVNTLR